MIKQEGEDDDGEVVLISSNAVSSSLHAPIPLSSQPSQDGVKTTARKSTPGSQEQQQQQYHSAMNTGMVEVMEIQEDNDCRIEACFQATSSSSFGSRFSSNLRLQQINLISLSSEKKKEAATGKQGLEKLSIASQVTRSVLNIANTEEEGDSGCCIKNGESGFIKHDFPEAEAESEVLRGSDPVPEDVPGLKMFSSVRELAIPGQTTMYTVPAG